MHIDPNDAQLQRSQANGSYWKIVAHEMSLKDKEELHNKSSGAYKASCDAPTSSCEKQTFNEELSLMVKNFNKFYKSRSKERSSKSRSYNHKRSSSHERNCYNCGIPRHYSNVCTPPPYKRREDSPKRRSKREESPSRERRSRDDRYEQRPSRKGKTSHQGATQKEDIKLMLVNGYPVSTPTITPKEVITRTPNILKMKVLPD